MSTKVEHFSEEYRFLFWVRNNDFLSMRVTTKDKKRREISTGILVLKADKWNAQAQRFDKNPLLNQKLDACKFLFLQKSAPVETPKKSPKATPEGQIFLFWVRHNDILMMRITHNTKHNTKKRREISTGILVCNEDEWNQKAQRFDKNPLLNQKLDAWKSCFFQELAPVETPKLAPKDKKLATKKATSLRAEKNQRHQAEMAKTLNEEQMDKLEKHRFEGKLQRYADIFIILMRLGINYSHYLEIQDFSKQIEEHGGMLFYHDFRSKNGGEVLVPLASKALEVLKKYNYKPPKLSHQSVSKQLKKIGQLIGVEGLSIKYGRKTLANYLLNNGASIETAATALGHKDTTMLLRHYAKVQPKKVMSEIGHLFKSKTN